MLRAVPDTTVGHLASLPPITFTGWEAFAGAVVITLVLMLWQALLIERALALLFEAPFYRDRIEPRFPTFKPIIAYSTSYLAVWWYGFDAFAMVLGRPLSTIGVAITAASVCGGSKWVISLASQFIEGAKEIRDKAEEIKKEQ